MVLFFQTHPVHLSLLVVLEVHNQGNQEDLCLQGCQVHLVHQVALALLSSVKNPACGGQTCQIGHKMWVVNNSKQLTGTPLGPGGPGCPS